MSRRPLDGSARYPRLWSSIAPALLAAVGLMGACFDSDETPPPLELPQGTTGVVPPPASSSSSGFPGSSSGDAEVTCRDAITCVQTCATDLQLSMSPEVDLTCFLECEPGMTLGELLDLFYLTECVTNYCIDLGLCDILVPTESTSTTGDSGSDSGSSTGDGVDHRYDCINCVFGAVNDPNPPGCEEFAVACE